MALQELERNKKYRISVVLGYNGSKMIRHTEIFYGGKKEARLRENEIKNQNKNHTFVKRTKKTVQELMIEYMEFKKSEWTPKTYIANKKRIENINNKIGHNNLQELNAKTIESFYKYLKDEIHYSDSTIKKHYEIINNALNTAVKWDYITFNVNSKVTKPKPRPKEVICYSPEEVEKLIKVIQNEPLKYQAIILLALDSGCRRGELTGLLWEDIDFKNSTININKTTQYLPEYGIFETKTKSRTSDRKIYISSTTLNILRKYRSEQLQKKLLLGNKWGNSKRVFTTQYGQDMHPDTPSQILRNIIKKYNLKKIKFHALRHTSISLMISKGVQLQIISKKAGHSNTAITHQIYSHFFDDEFKEVANIMNDFLQIKKA